MLISCVLFAVVLLNKSRYVIFFSAEKHRSRDLICAAYRMASVNDELLDIKESLRSSELAGARMVFSRYGVSDVVGEEMYILRSPIEFPALTGSWNLFLRFKNGRLIDSRVGDFDGNTYAASPGVEGCQIYLRR